MRLKSLEFGCGISISSTVLLAWTLPGGAVEPGKIAITAPSSPLVAPADKANAPTIVTPSAVPTPPESFPQPEKSDTYAAELKPAPAPTAPNIQVTGSSIFTDADLRPILQPWLGKTPTPEELKKIADEITKLYLERGYITSRAVVEPGANRIRAIEGAIENIEIFGLERVKPNYVRSRLQLATGKPLNALKLEDQLRLLRADPLFTKVEASLRAGSDEGLSILSVRVVEANPWDVGFSIDNYSPPSVGSERLGARARYRNLTGNGDQIGASYYRTTTGGSETLDLDYLMPLPNNPMNGTLQFRTVLNRNVVTLAPFNIFNLRGDSQLVEVNYRQPVLRSPRQELALSFGFAYQNGQTFTFAGPTPFSIGPDANGVSRTSVFKFGQDYIHRDPGGVWAARSLFSFGTGLFNATINAEPIPDSLFVSWLGQVQRVQSLNENNLLIVQGDLQLSSYSLLPSQQFVIGGGQSLRGYRQNVRAGDSGFRFSVEDRITLERDETGASTWQLAPFFDAGAVWNASGNPNVQPSQTFLAGLGLGVIWQPISNFNIRVDYGLPLVNLSDRGNNLQESAFYFSLNYQL